MDESGLKFGFHNMLCHCGGCDKVCFVSLLKNSYCLLNDFVCAKKMGLFVDK